MYTMLTLENLQRTKRSIETFAQACNRNENITHRSHIWGRRVLFTTSKTNRSGERGERAGVREMSVHKGATLPFSALQADLGCVN